MTAQDAKHFMLYALSIPGYPLACVLLCLWVALGIGLFWLPFAGRRVIRGATWFGDHLHRWEMWIHDVEMETK